ncbi:hypothetical protein QM012_005536 [Aureobasidium pullulans]|uniref:Lysine-specific metallo-endopeptidase domain-containing protein n=1 Tax=Aureobasidium pullulans TaxID=5580 RepID=A0ABR0T5Z2_AURPU
MPDAGNESDSSSVVSVTTPPSDRLRTYTAMDPPQLPNVTVIGGDVHQTEWNKHIWRYTARKDIFGTGFEVRQMQIDTFDGYEVPDMADDNYWLPKYNLGPPTQTGYWNGLIEKWGFPVLEKAGFLNYYPRDGDDYIDPIGRLASKRNPSGDLDQRIHPVLRQDMWRDLDDDQYQTLEQVLLLASALLDDPATLAIFHAIVDVNSMTEFNDIDNGKCKVAHIPATLSDEQEAEVYRKILAMRDWMDWSFAPQKDMIRDNALAITVRRYDGNGQEMRASSEHCHQSSIKICQTFLDILRRYDEDISNGCGDVTTESLKAWSDLVHVPVTRRPRKLDGVSAYNRTCFFLAHTIVHEFFHAFNAAYFPVSDDQTPISPWLHGNRSNELGNATINHLLGGEPFAMIRYGRSRAEQRRQECAAPYGLWSAKQWDLWSETTDDKLVRATTADRQQAFKTVQVFYPVPQKYVHNMTTRKTWTHQVPRYGLAALQVPKLEDWAIAMRKT